MYHVRGLHKITTDTEPKYIYRSGEYMIPTPYTDPKYI